MDNRHMKPRTSWLAVASFVFMVLLLLSLLLEQFCRNGPNIAPDFLWPGYVSLAFGVLALVHMAISKQKMKGCWLAWIAVLVSAVLIAYVQVDNRQFRRAMLCSRCRNNLSLVAWVVRQYAEDHDDRLPSADRWSETIRPYVIYQNVYYCPALKSKKEHTYALNSRVAGLRLEDIANPSEVVMFFESVPGRDLAGGANLFPRPPRHRDGYPVLFCDGKVRVVSESEIGTLVWQPKMKGREGRGN